MAKYLGEEGLKQLVNLIKDNGGGVDYSKWIHPYDTTFVIGDNSSAENLQMVFNIWGGLEIANNYIDISFQPDGTMFITPAKTGSVTTFFDTIVNFDDSTYYKGDEIATLNDLKSKQDTLEYYSEESGGPYGSTARLDAGIVYYNEYEVLNAGNAMDLVVPTSISATVSGNSVSGKINVTVSPSYACKGVIFYPITDQTTYTIDPEGNYVNNTEVVVMNYTIRVYSAVDQSVYTDVILNSEQPTPDPDTPDEPEGPDEPGEPGVGG